MESLLDDYPDPNCGTDETPTVGPWKAVLDGVDPLNGESSACAELTRALFDRTPAGCIVVDFGNGRILAVNESARAALGMAPFGEPEAAARDLGLADLARLRDASGDHTARQVRELRRLDGSPVPVVMSVTPLNSPGGKAACVTFVDLSEAVAAEGRLQRVDREMQVVQQQLAAQRAATAQSEKLASIGQLAAGVAHEINNPIGFVTSNLATISEYLDFLRSLVVLYRQLHDLEPDDGRRRDLDAELAAVLAEEDLDFVLGDLDGVLRESVEGASRVADIVQNLKSFARHDSQDRKLVDLNDCVESMIKLVWNELKYSCTVEKDLGDVPQVAGHSGQICQVIMNLLVNAAHAIGKERGTITVSTRQAGAEAVVSIADNGRGMTPEVMARIFEPFFTTKDVGKGTGLGLSISHGIITDHGGSIEVESTPGVGSTFRLVLPLPTGEDDTIIG